MLLFIEWLDDTVAHLPLLVLGSVLFFDFFIQLDQVLLSLLFLVVLHELLEHLLSSLLALLPDVLLYQLVHAAQFLLGPLAHAIPSSLARLVACTLARSVPVSPLAFAFAALGALL